MRPSHEHALAATARISCATLVWVAACRPSTSAPPPVANEDASQPVVVAEPDPYASDPALDPSLTKPPISSARATIEQCQAQVTDVLSRGALGPEDARCCEALAKNVYSPLDTEVDEATAAERSRKDSDHWWSISGSCCSLIGHAEAACTPWGPPTPPSLLAREPAEPPTWLDLRSLARAARPALPDAAAIDERLRGAAIATWRARMVNEHGSARVFEGLFAQLDALALLDADELARAGRFAAQERRHGVLCGAVVEALGGAAQATALPSPAYPRHRDAASELEACLRNLLSVCCLSETVAVALIAAERQDMPEGPLRELLTRIWAEECGHANFGWRVLPALLERADAATHARLHAYLRVAFAELETHELAHLPIDFVAPEGGARYGLCDGRDARALFYATVERVIVPALDARGLAASRAWAERGRATLTATARS